MYLAYVIENLTQYDLTQKEAARLVQAGLLHSDPEEQEPEEYVLTAYVWDDLGLTGQDAFDLLDRFLGRSLLS